MRDALRGVTRDLFRRTIEPLDAGILGDLARRGFGRSGMVWKFWKPGVIIVPVPTPYICG